MVLFEGENGQGKSNLLEAIYILAIAKSPRASADRELVRWQSDHTETHTQVSAVVQRESEQTRVQIDLMSSPATSRQATGAPVEESPGPGTQPTPAQKHIRVNGVPRRASALVGVVNAVMFSAADLELVNGPPGMRRRYLDILISQLDQRYLKSLQKYQRVVYQRNHLLRRVREGSSRQDELGYWDDELVAEGKYIMARRLLTVRSLSELGGPIHRALTGDGEALEMVYRPSAISSSDPSESEMASGLRQAVEFHRQREIAQGVTLAGPHRDDLQLLIDVMDAGAYASRGQARTVVLAMKLAEAQYVMDQRGQEPILLLDDVLSELDVSRRAHVLERARRYQQCFITTADARSIEEVHLSRMSRYRVRRGKVERIDLHVDGSA